MKKVIVFLIVFFAVALISIIGVLGYTKFFVSPKTVFKKQFAEAMSKSMEYKPTKLKSAYEAMGTGPVEFGFNAKIDMEDAETVSEGSTNYHETSLTLSMNDDEEENNEENSVDENEETDDTEDTEEDGEEDIEISENDSGDEDDPLSEEEEFLSNYTWSSASGADAMQSVRDDELSDVPQDIIANYTITIDKPNKAENLSLEMTAKGEDKEYSVLNGEVNYNNKVLSTYVEGLHDKSIAVENKNLREMFENFEVDEEVLKYIPDSIELFEMSDEEINVLKAKITEFLMKTIDEYDNSAYSVSKTSEQYGKYINDTYTGKKATLKVPAKSMETKVVGFVKEIFTDETTLPSLKKTLTKDAKKEVLNSIDKIQKSVDKLDENQMMEISVSVSKEGAFKLSIKVDGENSVEFYEAVDPNKEKIETMIKDSLRKYKDNSKIITPGSTTYSYLDLGNDNIYQSEITYNEEDLNQMLDEYNSTLTTTESDEEDEEDEEGEDLYIDSFGTKRKIDYYKDLFSDKLLKVEFSFDNQEKNLLSGTMKVSQTENGKNVSSFNSIKEIKFAVKKSDGKNIKKITEDNGMIINSYSEDDFDDLKVEILANIEKYAQENPISWAAQVSSYMSLMRMFNENNSSGYGYDDYDSSNQELSEEERQSYEEFMRQYDDSSEEDETSSDTQESEEDNSDNFEE